MTNTFRGQDSMWKSTMTIASSIQCFKHSRRRVDKNASKDRQICLRLHQTVHAQIDSCSPEGVQRYTQKFRNQRIRCTFHNNMRSSKRQLFLNQQTARVDNVFLSITSSSIRDGHIETRTERKEHRMVRSHRFKIRQCRPSSRSLAQAMIARCPPFG